jgi:hypothetical protein
MQQPLSFLMTFRLQSSRTQKFIKGFVSFLALFLVKHGPQLVAATVDRVQPGIFMMLVQQVVGLCTLFNGL